MTAGKSLSVDNYYCIDKDLERNVDGDAAKFYGVYKVVSERVLFSIQRKYS